MRAKTTKAKALTVADIKAAVREAVRAELMEFHAQPVFKTEAVGKPLGEMTGPPPESKLTIPTALQPSYLANMVKVRQ